MFPTRLRNTGLFAQEKKVAIVPSLLTSLSFPHAQEKEVRYSICSSHQGVTQNQSQEKAPHKTTLTNKSYPGDQVKIRKLYTRELPKNWWYWSYMELNNLFFHLERMCIILLEGNKIVSMWDQIIQKSGLKKAYKHTCLMSDVFIFNFSV